MSCYLIKVENGHKVARSITSEEEYKQLRGSNEQKANLRLARAGNDAAKRRLGTIKIHDMISIILISEENWELEEEFVIPTYDKLDMPTFLHRTFEFHQ